MSRDPVRSQRGRVRRVAVIGAGPAGLAVSLACCRLGVPVLLVSSCTARTAHAARVQDGIAAALDVHGEGDDPAQHFQDSAREAGFLLSQAPIRAMTAAAPELVTWLEHIGVPLARTPDGRLDQRWGLGSRARRVAFAGLDTGRRTRDVLDDQVCRWEAVAVSDARGASIPGERMLQRLEGWELTELVRDDAGTAIGFVGRELATGTLRAFPADALCLATGAVFPLRSALLDSAAAAGIALEAGALAIGAEWMEPAALAVGTPRGPRPLGDGLLSAGARLWACAADATLPVDPSERRYLLAAHAGPGLPGAHELGSAIRRAAEGGQLYLDSSQLELAAIAPHVPLGEARAVRCPRSIPPAILGSLCGLWVDHEVNARGDLLDSSPRNHSTSISGLYAAGDCVALYRGRSELGGNALLSALFGGGLAARALAAHRESLLRSAFDLPGSVFEQAERTAEQAFAACLERDGEENPFALADDLLAAVSAAMVGADEEPRASETELSLGEQLTALRDRCSRLGVGDRAPAGNRGVRLALQLERALSVAELIGAALERQRSSLNSGAAPGALLASVRREGSAATVRFPSTHSYDCVGRVVPIFARFDTRFFADGEARDGAGPGDPRREGDG